VKEWLLISIDRKSAALSSKALLTMLESQRLVLKQSSRQESKTILMKLVLSRMVTSAMNGRAHSFR